MTVINSLGAGSRTQEACYRKLADRVDIKSTDENHEFNFGREKRQRKRAGAVYARKYQGLPRKSARMLGTPYL